MCAKKKVALAPLCPLSLLLRVSIYILTSQTESTKYVSYISYKN